MSGYPMGAERDPRAPYNRNSCDITYEVTLRITAGVEYGRGEDPEVTANEQLEYELDHLNLDEEYEVVDRRIIKTEY